MKELDKRITGKERVRKNAATELDEDSLQVVFLLLLLNSSIDGRF